MPSSLSVIQVATYAVRNEEISLAEQEGIKTRSLATLVRLVRNMVAALNRKFTVLSPLSRLITRGPN
ncbi:hypothetical protein CCP3SC1_980002 [Gammaproteobacteria bacterium]